MGMSANMVIILTFILLAILSTACGLSCYECNVYMSGYGDTCFEEEERKGRPDPVLKYGRTVEDCTVCMKVTTKTKQGFYKNTPNEMEIYSRICAKSRNVRYRHGCHDEQVIGGSVRRCFCTDDLCNNAPKGCTSKLALMASVLLSFLYARLFYL